MDTVDEIIKKIRTSIFGLHQPRAAPAGLPTRLLEILEEHTAQLGFTAVPEVRRAMADLAGLLAPPTVSAERIQGELTKLLLSPRPGGPAAGIELLVDTGVAEQVLPEIPRMRLE